MTVKLVFAILFAIVLAIFCVGLLADLFRDIPEKKKKSKIRRVK